MSGQTRKVRDVETPLINPLLWVTMRDRPRPLSRSIDRGPRDRGVAGGPRQVSRRVLLTGAAGVAIWWVLSRRGSDIPEPLYRRARFGAYADNAPYPDLGPFFGLEQIVVSRIPTISWFQDIAVPWLSVPADRAATAGHDLCIAWQPANSGHPIPFADILSGIWDAQVTAFFEGAGRYPGRVRLRPFWEMNTTAPGYALAADRSFGQVRDLDEFRATWRYLVDRQRRVGGERVSWMFCVNGSDVGDVRMEDYWPGPNHVDELGLDTYNDTWAPWTSFADKVRPMYDRLVALSPGLPVVVAEVGTRENDDPDGPDKAAWVRDMFVCQEFPNLTEVYFFHSRRESDFRLDSSPAALAAYREFLPQAPGGGAP